MPKREQRLPSYGSRASCCQNESYLFDMAGCSYTLIENLRAKVNFYLFTCNTTNRRICSFLTYRHSLRNGCMHRYTES
jgi:hypothetical protein